jgi:hypothetical protein
VVFFQPLLAVMGFVGIVLGIAATMLTLVLSRKWQRSGLVLILTLLGLLGVTTAIVKARERQRARRAFRSDSGQEVKGTLDPARYKNDAVWTELVRTAFCGEGDPERLPILVESLFAAKITHDQKGVLSRQELLTWLEQEYHTSLQDHRGIEGDSCGMNKTGGPFPVHYQFEWFGEVPGGIASGASCTFRWRGLELGDPSRLVFNRWDTDSVTLYEVEPRPLEPEELDTWLRQFLAELGRPGSPELENYALPMMLARRSDDSSGWELTPRDTMVGAFRRTRTNWFSLEFFLRERKGIRQLSGGRWEVTATVNWLGVRADGQPEQPASPMNWRMEIVPVKGSWRILQLDM